MDKNKPIKIEFNYHARGFYCPTCFTGVALNNKECKYCGQKLLYPYNFKTRENNKSDIDNDYIRGRRLTDKESMNLMIQDINFNEEKFNEVVKKYVKWK